jgi:alkyl hydroperoxide reductase subunit AhpC
MAQVDLIPEPEGGQELIPNNSMDGTRVKLMGEAHGLSSDDGTVYKFWMRTIAQGELIKKFKIDILKESKKKVRNTLCSN